MNRILILALGALVACGGDDSDGTPDGGGGTSPATATCANRVLDTHPDPADKAFYLTTVEYTLSTAEPTATITLADSAGADVAGTNEVIDTRVIFTPAAPLAAGATYTSTLNWGCAPVDSTFTVGAAGESLGDPASLTDRTWSLDLASGRFIEPAGVEVLLQTFLTFSLLLGVQSSDADSIQFIGALADDAGNQDVCTESIPFPVEADFTGNPYFEIASDALPIEVEGFSVTIEDLLLAGAFTPNGDTIEGVALQGSINTVSLVEALDLGTADSNPGAVCDLVATFQVECKECSDGSGPYCLAVSVDSMTAAEVPGVTLEEITAEEIDANPTCNSATR
jgi:hypothetical protein